MKALLINNIVQEIIPDVNPAFPDIPIEARYAADFLARCVDCDESVQTGWIYEDGSFTAPPEPEPIDEEPELIGGDGE